MRRESGSAAPAVSARRGERQKRNRNPVAAPEFRALPAAFQGLWGYSRQSQCHTSWSAVCPVMRAAQVTYTSIGSARLGIAGSPWGAVWLGKSVLVLAGLFVLADIIAAKTASTILFGLALLAAGTFEIVHAFWVAHWAHFFCGFSWVCSTLSAAAC